MVADTRECLPRSQQSFALGHAAGICGRGVGGRVAAGSVSVFQGPPSVVFFGVPQAVLQSQWSSEPSGEEICLHHELFTDHTIFNTQCSVM